MTPPHWRLIQRIKSISRTLAEEAAYDRPQWKEDFEKTFQEILIPFVLEEVKRPRAAPKEEPPPLRSGKIEREVQRYRRLFGCTCRSIQQARARAKASYLRRGDDL